MSFYIAKQVDIKENAVNRSSYKEIGKESPLEDSIDFRAFKNIMSVDRKP